MNFPPYNSDSDFSLATYELVKALFVAPVPAQVWSKFDRAEKSAAFSAVLRIYEGDHGVVEADATLELAEDENVLPVVFSRMSELLPEEIFENLEPFMRFGQYFESPVVEEFLSENASKVFEAWGNGALPFFRHIFLNKKFHHGDTESHLNLSEILFHLSEQLELAPEVERIYLDLLKDWQWNHPVINADAMVALSLLKSQAALPLISDCLASGLFDERIVRPNHIQKNYGLKFEVGGEQAPEGSANSVAEYAGDENFAKLLYQVAYLDIDEARLMAMSEILSPEQPKPSSLISRILSQEMLDEGDEPYAFCNPAEGMRFFNQVLAFWNECLKKYGTELPPLTRPPELATMGYFLRVDSFFQPLLSLLQENSKLFTPAQKEFLRSYRNLREEMDDWWQLHGATEFINTTFEERLKTLWQKGYPS